MFVINVLVLTTKQLTRGLCNQKLLPRLLYTKPKSNRILCGSLTIQLCPRRGIIASFASIHKQLSLLTCEITTQQLLTYKNIFFLFFRYVSNSPVFEISLPCLCLCGNFVLFRSLSNNTVVPGYQKSQGPGHGCAQR